jgi:hypothetical protein
MAKNLKQLCAGIVAAVVLSGAGVYFINKMLQEENNKKKAHKTEQVVKDMSAQGISVFKEGREGAPDSLLASVDMQRTPFSGKTYYLNPKYKVKESGKTKIKLGKKETKVILTSEEAKRFIDFKIEALMENGLPDNSVKNEIKKLKKAKENMHEGDEVEGIVIVSNSTPHGNSRTTQNFEYEKDETAWDYSSTEPKNTSKSVKSNGATWKYDIEVRELSSGVVVEFHTNSYEDMMELIRKNNKNRNMLTGELKLSEDTQSKADDNTFGKIEKATAKVRRHGEDLSGSLRFKNPNEQQVTAKQQRAPKKKSTKRRMNRDALPGRTLANMKVGGGRKS